jgi:iron-sulfur cluster repair protein YtfE (RIC family)
MVITKEKTLGELVAEIPGAARILEKYRIDYCCGENTHLRTPVGSVVSRRKSY